MPQPPGIIDRVNYVIDFAQNPCDAPWAVYVETALPAALDLFIALATFGLDDIVRGYFRPKGLRSYRHGRRGRRAGRVFRGIPEPGELIARRLPGFERARGRRVSNGVKTLWLIDGVLQRGLWYWLLIDEFSEFFYNWTSMLNKTEFCQKANQGRALATKDQLTGAFRDNWLGFGVAAISYEQGPIQIANLSAQALSGVWQLVLAASVTNTGTSPGDAFLGLARGTDPTPLNQDQGQVLPGQTIGLVVTQGLTVLDPGFTALWKLGESPMVFEDISLFAIQTG